MTSNQNINPAAINPDFWASNIDTLKTRAPELSERLKAASSDFCRVLPAESGDANLLYLEPGKKAVYLHSPRDPVAEAKRMVSGPSFNGEDMTVFFGLGLGYLPLEIIKRMHSHHRLVIIEASVDILATACRSVDLTALFNDRRVHIFLSDQLSAIWRVVQKELFKTIGGSMAKLIHPPSFKLFPDTYGHIESEIESFVRVQQANYSTLECHRPRHLRNILANLTATTRATAVDVLFGTALGRPVLVVAAGPSLDKNIGRIKQASAKFVIIAVDTALKPLLAEDIRPDLVVSVDPNGLNFKKFAGIEHSVLKNLSLVFSPLLFPDIAPLFERHFVFGEQHRFSQWALSLREPVTDLAYGFTVAQHAFYLARQMGADPIVFAGLDLAFAPDGDHAKNSAMNWKIDYNSSDLPKVPGLDGQLVTTCDGFVHMITLFEREIAATDALCIDASEGGALIRGTKVMTLEETIAYLNPTLDDDFAIIKMAPAQTDLGRAADGLKWLLGEAKAVQSDCASALLLHNRLASASGAKQPNQDEIKKIMSDINRIADTVDGRKRFLAVIKDFMGAVMVQQYKSRFQVARQNDPNSRQKLQIESSYIFLERLKEIADELVLHAQPVLKDLYRQEKDVS